MYCGDAFSDLDGIESAASAEGFFVYGFNRIADDNFRERSAVKKCIFRYLRASAEGYL